MTLIRSEVWPAAVWSQVQFIAIALKRPGPENGAFSQEREPKGGVWYEQVGEQRGGDQQ